MGQRYEGIRQLSTVLVVVLLVLKAANVNLALNQKCFRLSSDLVFALDSSFSIRLLDYRRQLSFIRALLDQFTLGHNHVQVGLVSFGSTVRLDIRLDQFSHRRDLKEAVSKIQQMHGGTNTQDALHFIRTSMFEPSHGGRPWAKKQLVLITDGLSSNSSATLLEASLAKSMGIEVFSVLVGEGFEDLEIRGVASEPKDRHVFHVENYKALAGIESTLTSATCNRLQQDKEDDDNVVNPNQVAIKACEDSSAEVVFLMDSSNSIWQPDFLRQIQFIQQVTSSFHLDPDLIRVGVAVYSDTPLTLISLDDPQSHKQLQQALAQAPYITGSTHTALALRHARQRMLAGGVARPGVAQVVILLSDGDSHDMEQAVEEAHLQHQLGIHVFAVGVGANTSVSDLMALASDPDSEHVFQVGEVQNLSEIQELLAVKVCDATSTTKRQEVCPSHPTDVVFIYDNAALSRHHNDYVIEVISGVTSSPRLNHPDLRVGVIRESSPDPPLTTHDIELTSLWGQTNFQTRLDPTSGSASVDSLFRKVRHKYFQSKILTNQEVPHKRTIILFLDSVLENPYGAVVEALRLIRSQVVVVVVTLGKRTDTGQVTQLASTPHEMFLIHSPGVSARQRRLVVAKLVNILCS